MKAIENLLHFAPLLAALTWATVTDVCNRRIPNALTLPLALAGIAASMTGHLISPSHSLLGFLVGFALPLPAFLLGAMGGGDVKLLAAVGAWVGPGPVFVAYLVAAVVGLAIVLTQAAVRGRLVTLFRNSAVVVVNLIHLKELGTANAQAVGQSCRSVDKPLPYAVPIFAGVLFVLASPWML